MADDKQAWWHLILTCHGQWLHGDPRGFRSRDHRLHSSGDYKQRPPAGEHKKLHRWMKVRSGGAITIPSPLREPLATAIVRKVEDLKFVCPIVAAGQAHTHLLVKLQDDYGDAKRLAGQLKRASSHALRNELPGKVWASGGKPIRVKNREHQLSVYDYIERHRLEGAYVWEAARSAPQERLLKPMSERSEDLDQST